MPFPFSKKSATKGDPSTAPAPPAFSKKSFGRKRKTGKATSAQKALRQSGRAMSGGGR